MAKIVSVSTNPVASPAIVAPITVTQGLARAGVDMNTAGLKNVVVISMDGDNQPHGTVLNLRAAIRKGRPSASFLLGRNDVVFVPKSTIAKIDKFVDQYIAKLLLFRGFTVVVDRTEP